MALCLIQGEFFCNATPTLQKSCGKADEQSETKTCMTVMLVSCEWVHLVPFGNEAFSFVARYRIEGTAALFSQTMPYATEQYFFLLSCVFTCNKTLQTNQTNRVCTKMFVSKYCQMHHTKCVQTLRMFSI